jgi:hypothetical protein
MIRPIPSVAILAALFTSAFAAQTANLPGSVLLLASDLGSVKSPDGKWQLAIPQSTTKGFPSLMLESTDQRDWSEQMWHL